MAQQGEIRVVMAKVESASLATQQTRDGEQTVWKLKLLCPTIWPRYAIPCQMPSDRASQIIAGQDVKVKMQRGRIRKEEFDGSRDTDYYWDIIEWDTQEQTTAAPARPAPAPGRSTPAGSPGPAYAPESDFRRSKEEMRKTEAWHVASRLAGPWQLNDMDSLRNLVDEVYNDLAAVDPPPAKAAPAPAEQPQEAELPMRCTVHQMDFDKTSPNSGAKYHTITIEGRDRYCVQGKGLAG